MTKKNKSSLKMFLNGKTPFTYTNRINWYCISSLKGSITLGIATSHEEKGLFYLNDGIRFNIDVLDDGTAITYCPDK